MSKKSKKVQTEASKKEPEALPVEAPTVNVAALVAPAVPAATPAHRKVAPGKEPIPFRWKLVGEAPGAILTLFKSVEREEIDAQLERVKKEGYYANLQIFDINHKIIQPKPPKPPKAPKAPPHAPAKAKAGEKAAKTKKAHVGPAKAKKDTKPAKAAKAPAASKAVSSAKRPRPAKPAKKKA